MGSEGACCHAYQATWCHAPLSGSHSKVPNVQYRYEIIVHSLTVYQFIGKFAAALPHKYNHRSPIITMTPLTSSTPHPSPLTTTAATDHEAIGLSFQLATLDSSGLVTIWVAVETKPHPQGSESDLGLVPGGQIKIVWSTSLDTVRYRGLGSKICTCGIH